MKQRGRRAELPAAADPGEEGALPAEGPRRLCAPAPPSPEPPSAARGRGSARLRPVPALAAARRRQGRAGAAPLACRLHRRPSTPRNRESAGSYVRSRGTWANWKRPPRAHEPGGGAAAPLPPGRALGSGAAPGVGALPSNLGAPERPSPLLPFVWTYCSCIRFSFNLSLLISKIMSKISWRDRNLVPYP